MYGALAAAALTTLGSTSAVAQFVGPTPLKLINGWTTTQYTTSVPEVEEVSGIVQFRGAISTSGTDPEPFVLPSEFRPATTVYVPIDLCSANKGRLVIASTGDVTVETENSFGDAQCFTSLDGASFARSAKGFLPLPLINGWTDAPYGTSDAAVVEIDGIVHFKGAIATRGTNPQPFVLPSHYWPAADVYIPVDLCNSTNGRLWIQPNGVVTVQAETSFSNAQCFTSLDGAWFVRVDSGFQTLALIDGWKDAPFDTGKAKAGNAYGIVYLQGSIATTGSNSEPFVLPPAFTPVTNVYVPIDLCNATKGRLFIQTNGAVSVEAQTSFGNAQCFTSLDGVSFVQ